MQKKKHFQTRKILADTLVIVLLALVLMPLHSWIFGTSLLDNPDNAKASVSELAYRIQRQQTEATQSDEISLVDISGLYGSSSRGDIAALLDSIYDMNPKLIGVDVRFPAPKVYSVYDSLLAQTAARIADKTVFVCELDSFDVEQHHFKHSEHSFFNSVKGYSEGYANLMQNGDDKPVRQYSLFQMLNGVMVYSFPAQLLINYLDEDDLSDNTPIIRFEPTLFTCLNSGNLNPELIRDRIVLVGDMHNRGDSHPTPLGWMQGLEIHAYTIQTILERNPIAQASVLVLLLLALAISAVHSFVVVSTDHLLKVKPSSMMEFVFKQGLVTMGVTYLLNIVMEYVSYISFTVFETSLALHTLIPEIIKLTAFAKVTYCIVYQVLYKRYAWKWLNYSSYSIQ
ncbi:MAG: CHASE2 domain-containing protein [Prevotella sp.]|nr:CHASE2 domain-containing protein [Prevotella sp.]